MHQTASLEENGVYNNDLVFGEHTGTHIDAPMHFAEGGLTTDQLPAERFFAPLVVLSIAARASGNPFYVTVLESLATQIAFGMTLSRSLTLQGAPDRQAKVEAEHRALIEAIRAADPEAAAAAMRRHVIAARDRMFEGGD